MTDHFDADKQYVQIETQDDTWVRTADWNTQIRILKYLLGEENFGNIFYDGAVIDGCRAIRISNNASVLHILPGTVYVNGYAWPIPATVITGYNPTKTSGDDYVYANWQIEEITGLTDSDLVDDRTGERTAVAHRFVVTLDREDRSGHALSGPNVIRKNTTPIIVWVYDRENGNLTTPNSQGGNTDHPINVISKMKLDGFSGLLDARKVRNFMQNWEFVNSISTLDYEVHGSYAIEGFELQRAWNAVPPSAGQVAFEVNSGIARVGGSRVVQDTPVLMYVDDASGHGAVSMPSQSFKYFGGGLHQAGEGEHFYELWANKYRGYYVNTITNFNCPSGWAQVVDMSAYVTRPGYPSWHRVGSDFAGYGCNTAHGDAYGVPHQISFSFGKVAAGTEGEDWSLETYDGIYYINWWSTASPTPNTFAAGSSDYECYVAGNDFKMDRDYTLSNNAYITFADAAFEPLTLAPFTVEYNVIPDRYDLVALRKYSRMYEFEPSDLIGAPMADGTVSIIEGIPALNPSIPDEPGGAMALGHLHISPWGSPNVKNYFNRRLTQKDTRLLEKRVASLEKRLSKNEGVVIANEQAYGTMSIPEGRIVDGCVDLSVADVYFNDSTKSFFATMDFQERAVINPLDNYQYTRLTYTSDNDVAGFKSLITVNTDSVETFISQEQWSSTVSLDPYDAYTQVGPFIKVSPNVENWFNTAPLLHTEIRNLHHAAHLKRYEANDVSRLAFSYIEDSIPSKYARDNIILVEGWGFGSGEDDISIYIDQVQCALSTAFIGTTGASNTKVIADSYGHFQVYATVSTSADGLIRDGGKEVYAVGENTETGYGLYKVMPHIGAEYEGRRTTFPKIANAAEIFFNDTQRFIGFIDIGFDRISSDKSPITIMLTKVSRGLPNGEILWQTTYTPNDFTGTFPGYERFTLDNPVYLAQDSEYAIVLHTASSEYVIQRAVLDEVGNAPAGTIRANPYPDGRFYLSENGLQWYPKEDESLRFRVVAHLFDTGDNILEFDGTTGLDNFCSFYCGPATFIPHHTSIVWEWSYNNSDWNTFNPNSVVDPDNAAFSTSLYIRATMNTTDSRVSPMIAGRNRIDLNTTVIPVEMWRYGTKLKYTSFPLNLPEITITDVGGAMEIYGDVGVKNAGVKIFRKTEDLPIPAWIEVDQSQIVKVRDSEDGFALYRWYDEVPEAQRGSVVRLLLQIETTDADAGLRFNKLRNPSFFGTEVGFGGKLGYVT